MSGVRSALLLAAWSCAGGAGWPRARSGGDSSALAAGESWGEAESEEEEAEALEAAAETEVSERALEETAGAAKAFEEASEASPSEEGPGEAAVGGEVVAEIGSWLRLGVGDWGVVVGVATA